MLPLVSIAGGVNRGRYDDVSACRFDVDTGEAAERSAPDRLGAPVVEVSASASGDDCDGVPWESEVVEPIKGVLGFGVVKIRVHDDEAVPCHKAGVSVMSAEPAPPL